MGTITCRCLTVIPTNHDSLSSYRGDLLPDRLVDTWAEQALARLKALIKAIEAGQSVAEFLGLVSSAKEIVEALLPWNISGESFSDLSRQVYQCPTCGRLLVETNQQNKFRTFLPESDDSHHILNA